ncbi:MAG: serine protein kinase PrkA [Planctomycetota bacterium]
MRLKSYIDQIDERSRARFEEQRSIETFEQYLEGFVRNPWPYLRTSAQYCLDMMDFFGSYEVERIGVKDRRWRVFDCEHDKPFDALVGQERVQNAIYRQLLHFARRGYCDKMLLLHGPNGSSKTTTVDLLFRGLEAYSREPEGALYRYSWIFSEKEERGRGERIGFESDEGAIPDSYAGLSPAEIAARIPCELKDPPLFLIPQEDRKAFIEKAIADCDVPPPDGDFNYEYFLDADLSPKSKRIYDALLASVDGDWTKVMRHVQVERYFISRRFRQGVASIEPQGNVDATVRPLNYEPTVQLPGLLQSLTLTEAVGDLVDANHGVVEYSDFLKRPIETNKYLLTTSEKGTIHLPGYSAYLDLVITATANEKQLSMFKRSPDFSSFKGRMELIQVPYLLMYSKEQELYQKHIDLFSRGRHVTPHTALAVAMWAVLTRLRRPSPKNYAPELAPLVARLTPMEKAKLYDHGELPLHLKDHERKLLEASIRDIRDEHNDAEGEFEGIPGCEYEGRRGASAREMMSLLGSAAENRKFTCVTPMAVFEELEKLVRDSSVYDFLRVPVDNGFNDSERFIEDVKQEYRAIVTQEVYDSIGLVEEAEYERVFEKYFHHVKAFDLGEKLFLPSRGEYVEPSVDLMERIEGLLDIHEPIETFRSNLIMKIAAYSIDHPDESIAFQEVFPQIYNTIKQSFYGERNRTLATVEQNILRYGSNDFEALSKEERDQVERALQQMESKFGYCQHCAKDVIAYILRYR